MDIYLVIISLFIMAVVMLGYISSLYNRVIRIRNIIPEHTSNIEVLRKKKEHLISKMEAIVESYGLHEKDIQKTVSGNFSGAGNPHNPSQSAIERLAFLKIAFPQLKADTLYGQLLSELATVENEIVRRREDYNKSVRSHNTLISEFPANIILSPLKFQPFPFLTTDDINS